MNGNQNLTNCQICKNDEKGVYMAKIVSKVFCGWVDVFPVRLVDFISFFQEDRKGYYDPYLWPQGFKDYQGTYNDLKELGGNQLYLRVGYHDNRKYFHPVTCINWLEAKAYARWRGSSLLNIQIWEDLTQHLFDYKELEKVNKPYIDELKKNSIINNIPDECIKFSKYGTIHLVEQCALYEWIDVKIGAIYQYVINSKNQRFQYRFDDIDDRRTFRCVIK